MLVVDVDLYPSDTEARGIAARRGRGSASAMKIEGEKRENVHSSGEGEGVVALADVSAARLVVEALEVDAKA
jgi:hypothetical protein